MLVFRLKKVWFDKIKSGEKTHEYKKKFKNAGECMAYVLEVRSEVGNKKL